MAVETRSMWRFRPCRLMISKCAVVVGNDGEIGPLTGSPLNRAAAGAMPRMGTCSREWRAFKEQGTLDAPFIRGRGCATSAGATW